MVVRYYTLKVTVSASGYHLEDAYRIVRSVPDSEVVLVMSLRQELYFMIPFIINILGIEDQT